MSIVALATANGLALVETSTLRRPPSSLPTSITLLAPPTASAWSTNQLFLASANTIHQYNPTANALTAIFSADADISHLVCRSTSTLVFATADTIHVLESSKLTRTLDSHKSPVTSLSLSNDSLASTSSSAVHLHDLTTGKLTVLRGLGGQTITTCAFHPHTPAKLLVGVGRKLVIFDTTRPSGPSKTIPLNDTTRGEIISVACSPFSKTLVAVATKGGHIGLVDLDKEKGVFRTLNLKVSITCMVFSPEGASLYIGSEMGTVLVVDLRALDKPPRSVSIGASGSRIGTLAVQKKSTKGPTESETKSHTAFNPRLAATAPSASLPLRSVSGNAPPGSPLRKTSTLSPRVFPKKVIADSPRVASRQPSSRNVSAVTSSRSSTNSNRKLSSAEFVQASVMRGASDSVSVGVRRPSSSASNSSSVPTLQTAGARAKTTMPASRTPSPELPSIHVPTTPIAIKKGWTPESPERGDDNIKAKGKGKTVNFEVESEKRRSWAVEKENERERSLSMQISPRRPSSVGVGNWAPSPLMPASPGGASTAHELLRGIVGDAMHDFQQEQRSQMVGLHVDMLKMGRDFRARLDEYLGDLKALREENQRLREENEFFKKRILAVVFGGRNMSQVFH